ncbi:MAG: HPr family phosphocarrier protein [Clostridium sp.]|nr:HPr family phosphocarrier protein [Ruminococcus flavefaciens]MCM1500671.1 HPr family phosphocarrier protein [Clostridium sp.]
MNRKKIRLRTIDDVTDFVNVCLKYQCDINVYDKSKTFDAKSILGILNIQLGKIIEVQAISSDECIILSFINDMRKFEI